MTDFRALLATLVGHGVEFIVVGGVAATVHGASRLTRDVDVVYARSDANLDRVVAALAPYRPYLRDVPPGLPFRLDRDTLRRGLNFTLTTDLGAIDLLGEIVGGGGYEALLPHAVAIEAYGLSMRCLGLEKLIEVKRAAGRPRDLEAVAELEAIREELRRGAG
jgi:predicted nucleotidyltransferase